MNVLHIFPVLLVILIQAELLIKSIRTGRVGFWRIGNVKGILKVAGWMLLWDEKGVKVPEASLDVADKSLVDNLNSQRPDSLCRRHLLKAHLEEDLTEFVANFVYYATN